MISSSSQPLVQVAQTETLPRLSWWIIYKCAWWLLSGVPLNEALDRPLRRFLVMKGCQKEPIMQNREMPSSIFYRWQHIIYKLPFYFSFQVLNGCDSDEACLSFVIGRRKWSISSGSWDYRIFQYITFWCRWRAWLASKSTQSYFQSHKFMIHRLHLGRIQFWAVKNLTPEIREISSSSEPPSPEMFGWF